MRHCGPSSLFGGDIHGDPFGLRERAFAREVSLYASARFQRCVCWRTDAAAAMPQSSFAGHPSGSPNTGTFLFQRHLLVAVLAAGCLASVPGCAVTRGQESVGGYVDDTAITTAVKTRFVENKEVDAASIGVETLNGTVMLSGFAKGASEKAWAEGLVWKVNGVKAVKNEIAIRP